MVEVLLATVVISIVLSGAYTLSNRASSINQASYDRSRASSYAQQQAELVRAARDTYDINGGTQSWDRITDPSMVQSAAAHQPLDTDCNDLSSLQTNRGTSSVFHIDDNNNFNSTIQQNVDGLFSVWGEVVQGPGGDFYDIHVYVCWEGVGRDDGQKLLLVLRLEEKND